MFSACAAYWPVLADDSTSPAPGDWPRYARDLGATRFSPLDQIDTSNVSRLEVAWTIPAGPRGMGALVSSATPIVLDGVMFYPAGNAVLALDAATGKEIWRHELAEGAVRRAVSYWPGDGIQGPHPAGAYMARTVRAAGGLH